MLLSTVGYIFLGDHRSHLVPEVGLFHYIMLLSTVGYICLGDHRLHLVPEVVGLNFVLYKLG